MDGFTPNKGDTFLLIDNRGNNPIFGQFVGLDHGAKFEVMGQQFLVNYQAGINGRGFALTAVPEPSSACLLIVAACVATRFSRRAAWSKRRLPISASERSN